MQAFCSCARACIYISCLSSCSQDEIQYCSKRPTRALQQSSLHTCPSVTGPRDGCNPGGKNPGPDLSSKIFNPIRTNALSSRAFPALQKPSTIPCILPTSLMTCLNASCTGRTTSVKPQNATFRDLRQYCRQT